MHAQDVIEHLSDTIRVMEEIHRISRNGARVHITVPHFSSANAYTDPTHCRLFSYFSFDYFDAWPQIRVLQRGAVQARQGADCLSAVDDEHDRASRRESLAVRYEQRWAWMFPAWFLSVDLEVIK